METSFGAHRVCVSALGRSIGIAMQNQIGCSFYVNDRFIYVGF